MYDFPCRLCGKPDVAWLKELQGRKSRGDPVVGIVAPNPEFHQDLRVCSDCCGVLKELVADRKREVA